MTFKFHSKNIHFTTEGSGETVVLLHGFLENLSMWNDIAKELSNTHRVIRLDLPGFGASQSIVELQCIKHYAECVQVLLKELNIDTFTVIGHSMGGYIALELSKMYPKEIKQLILFHSTANADSEQKKKDRDRALKAVRDKQSIYLKTTIPYLFPKQFQELCAPQIKKMIVEAEALNPLGIIAAIKAMKTRTCNNHTLSKLSCKKTYIAGTHDPLLSCERLKEEATNNGADFIEIEKAGHMSHWENNSQTIDVIKNTLN